MAKHDKADPAPVSEGLEHFLTYLREMGTLRNMAAADEQEANNETQDILHGLELGTIDATPRSVTRALVESRRKRRKAKNYIAVSDPLADWASRNKPVIGELQRILGDMRKIESKNMTRLYANRTDITDRI